MIVFDLYCTHGHRFEGWFRSSADFEDQAARDLVDCPHCGSHSVSKAPMAPAVGAKGNRVEGPVPAQPTTDSDTHPVSNAPLPAEMHAALKALAKAQEKALKASKWVGKDFAEQSRAMHYGERDEAPIHGQASVEEAKLLIDEGVPIAPLPFPVAPPEDLN